MPTPRRPRVHRGDRKPLYVPVRTLPAIRGCWSVNLSESGVGLLASPAEPGEGPREGQEVELEFPLPGVRARIRATGKVRWRHDAVAPQEDASAALGVQFLRFEGTDQVKVARYLASHRVRVMVAWADRDQADALAAAVAGDVELLHVASEEEVHASLRRGDVSAVVVCGTSEGRALRSLDQVLDALPRQLAPALVLWAPVRPQRALELFNAGRLFRALGEGCEEEALRAAVLGACRQHGVRLEQARMGLELERHHLRERARSGEPEDPLSGDEGPGFQSPRMQKVLELVSVVAPHRVAVLLQGETGTGKEVLARRIHRLSSRSAEVFIPQDCGALTETLLESELFGHVKGAFTGAVSDHPGLFVLADGGTIFLDEIENTTANLQARLLRVIETGEVRPVGGSSVRQVDVRLVAASNRNLEDEVAHGRFRSDLFFRLNTFVVEVPPLRERPDDLLPLALHFIGVSNAALGRSARGLSEEARALLLRLEWRGNIRELRNVMERAVLLTPPGQEVGVAQLPDALVARATAGRSAGGRSFLERLAEAERAILQDALERAGGVLRRAAAELVMDPVTLGRRAKRLGLWPSSGNRRTLGRREDPPPVGG